jgi:hypothetical protein
MRRIACALALLLLPACEGITTPDDGDWEFSRGTDNISGRPWAHARNNSFDGMLLYVRCREGEFDVYVTTDFITDSGAVRYRIDDNGHRSETWTESTDFQALFYRGDSRAFARTLARSSRLIFEAREYVDGLHQATFHLEGLDIHLPEIESACP